MRILEKIVKTVNLKKYFPVRLGFLRSLVSRRELFVRAVDGISFDVEKAEIFALVGESGSGKTTTGRVLLKLTEPTDGTIYFGKEDITELTGNKFKPYRRKLQIVFQDPYESLNPKMTIFDIMAEPLLIQDAVTNEQELMEKVCKALEDVQLVPPQEFIYRYPHELSGGQRQRVATGRALILDPEFVVADEPVSMLDASIRAEILNLMHALVDKYKVAILYITHDIALARHICQRMAVMYLGKIMEMGAVEDVVYKSLHPYTKALISAVPSADPTAKRIEAVLKGEIPSPVNPPSGCRFHTRCPEYIGDICKAKEPEMNDVSKGHCAACHLYRQK